MSLIKYFEEALQNTKNLKSDKSEHLTSKDFSKFLQKDEAVKDYTSHTIISKSGFKLSIIDTSVFGLALDGIEWIAPMFSPYKRTEYYIKSESSIEKISTETYNHLYNLYKHSNLNGNVLDDFLN